MNGKDLLNEIKDFIKSNKLEDVEMQDFDDFTFSVFLDEEKCEEIQYTLDPTDLEEEIKYFLWDREEEDIVYEEIMTREQAFKRRFPDTKVTRARRYRIVVCSDQLDPFDRTDYLVNIAEEIRRRFLPLCSTPGRYSPILEKIAVRRFRDYQNIDIFATKENFEKMLEQMEYEKIYPRGRAYYKFIKFKEEA